jgi:hypothetical protein
MQPSFHTAPTKPEKGTKGNTQPVKKRDVEIANNKKPKSETPKPHSKKKH